MKKETIKKGAIIAAGVAALTSALLAFNNAKEKPQLYIPEDDDDDDIIVEVQKEEKNFLEKMPFYFRNTISGILTLIVSIVIHFIDKLVYSIPSFIAKLFLSIFVTFILLLLLVVAIMKLLFPKMKLKDILTKKRIIALLIASVIINVIDLLLFVFVKEYRKVKILVKTLLIFIAVALILNKVIKANLAFSRMLENIN